MKGICSVKNLCYSFLFGAVFISHSFPSHAVREGEFVDPRLVRASLAGLLWNGDIDDTINGSPVEIIDGETGEPFEFPSGGAAFAIDATYFVLDHFAVEAAISYAEGFDRDFTYVDIVGTTQTRSYNFNMVPLDLNFQYHFAPYGKLTPYVGAGVTYAIFPGDKVTNQFGYNAKFGMDYWSSRNVSLSFAVKQYFGIEPEVEIDFDETNELYEADIDVSPTYVSLGFGYRF